MDELVTLFGGGGFLGRYVAQALMRRGARVRIAQRDPRGAFFLRPLGGLGQTQFVAVDVTREDSARRAAAGSTAVINLVGVMGGDFARAHVVGARNAARAAAAAGANAFVQVSAIGADTQAESVYARTKGEGEQAAREAFPGATIIRPSVLFGAEDRFVNRFAAMMEKLPAVPVVRGSALFQPAWVSDVAQAIADAALDPRTHAGRTYELGGPQRISMEELNRWIARTIGRKVWQPVLPDAAASAMARYGGWAPGAPITWDQWLLLQHDNVVPDGAAGFEAFGIDPRPLAAVAPAWLVRFRKHGRFSLSTAA